MFNSKFKKILSAAITLGISTVAVAGTNEEGTSNTTDFHPVIKRNQTPRFYTNTWFDKLSISGLFVGEAIFANYNFEDSANKRFNETETKNTSTLCFPRAILNLDSQINDWVHAHFSFNFRCACGYGAKNDEWAFSKYMSARTDEANVTIGNLEKSPYYSRIGIQYLPYGVYKRHTIPATLTQLLTQTQASAITFGFIDDSGYNGSAYVFSGKNKRDGTQQIRNGGIQIGYDYKDPEYEVSTSLDYMYNIAGGVNYIVHKGLSTDKNPINEFGYRKAVSGLSFSVKGKKDNIDATLQYTTAVGKFDDSDISWKDKGARPSAWMVDVGNSFESFGKNSRVGASYQRSSQAVNIRGNSKGRGLPKHRLQADYTVDIFENFEVGAHLVWDKDYGRGHGGTNRSTLTGLINMVAKIG